MNRANLITLLIIAAIIAGVAYVTYRTVNPGETTENSDAARNLLGDETKPVTYLDLDGNTVDLTAYAGQIRIVNSWATWCPFCVEELSDFSKLAVEAGDDVVVIAINRKESASKQKAFLSQLDDLEGVVFVQDPADHFYESIGGFTMPETLYYDHAGAVAVHKRGFMTVEEMRTHLETTRSAHQEE